MGRTSDFMDGYQETPSKHPVSFGEKLMNSESFKTLFREGMGLVEETAASLDGDGRQESRLLARNVALAYATESMRLTTRLMQIASWLLIQRAANEGEITHEQALEERRKVKLTTTRSVVQPEVFAELPERLRVLVGQAERLQKRVLLLDKHLTTMAEQQATAPRVVNPIRNQLSLIHTAFGLAEG